MRKIRRDTTVMFFRDLYKALQRISDEDAGVLMKAVFAMVNDLDPDEHLDRSPIASAMFPLVADQIERLEEYRNEQAEKRNKVQQSATNEEQTGTNTEQSTSPSPYPSPNPYPDPSPMTGQAGLTDWPTTREVRAWAETEGLTIDAERFCSYYDQRGWMTGDTPIKDWKKVARSWAETERPKKDTPKPAKKVSGKYEAWAATVDYGDLVEGRARA